MQPTPDIAPSSQWQEAWDGAELHELSKGRGANTIRNRKCVEPRGRQLLTHVTVVEDEDPRPLTRYCTSTASGRQPGASG